jgi:tetratricopeptide (TPR) repeat protein
MATKKTGSTVTPRTVEQLIEEERWVDARRAIEFLLRDCPGDHWLLTRLSTNYYEIGDYEKALELANQALAITPDCPLALWDRAGALDMLGREAEALEVYTNLLLRAGEAVASNTENDFGEGPEWTLGLLADCIFRVACILEESGKGDKAVHLFSSYLKFVDLGAPSIYSREEAAAMLQTLIPKKDRRASLKKAVEAVTKELILG